MSGSWRSRRATSSNWSVASSRSARTAAGGRWKSMMAETWWLVRRCIVTDATRTTPKMRRRPTESARILTRTVIARCPEDGPKRKRRQPGSRSARASAEALHEILEDEAVEDRNGQADDEAPRHERAPVEAVATDQVRHQAHRAELLRPRRHVHHGVEEHLHREGERKDRRDDDALPGERNHHAHEGAHEPTAIYPRGFLDLLRYRFEVRHHLPRAEGDGEGGIDHDEGPPGVE